MITIGQYTGKENKWLDEDLSHPLNKLKDDCIYEGDCLEFMKMLPDKYVDFVITDPPYNFDKGFDNDNLPQEDFWKWIDEVFKEVSRIIKDDSFLVVDFCRKDMHKLVSVIGTHLDFDDYFGIFCVNTMAQCRYGYDKFSLMAIFKKGEPKVSRRWQNLNKIVRYSNGKNYLGHPTQKDKTTYRQLIKMLSKKGDLVFDCFAGSGTTAISCKELERKFLGCEINPEYVKIIRKRLTQTSVGDFNPLNEESLISVKRESADSPNSPHDSSTIKEEANFS